MNMTEQRLSKLEGAYEQVDQRLGDINAALARIDGRFAAIEARLDAMDARNDARFSSIDGRFAAIEARLDAMDARNDARFAAIDRMVEHYDGHHGHRVASPSAAELLLSPCESESGPRGRYPMTCRAEDKAGKQPSPFVGPPSIGSGRTDGTELFRGPLALTPPRGRLSP